jgi:hypothetical protein
MLMNMAGRSSRTQDSVPLQDLPADPFPGHPRIPVTPSMLLAYSHLRGPKFEEVDPLHDALYPAMSRTFPQGKLVLPQIVGDELVEA